MAEVVGMRNNALPYPVYGVSFTIVYPMLDADGDPVTGATTPDAERSLNGDTFADCTNESTEIATNSGMYYLTLTAAEMTADIVTVIAKSATAGMKTTCIVLYPRKLPILSTGTCQGANDTGDIQLASADSAIDDIYNGCLCVAVIDGTTEARIINDYVGSTRVGEVSPAWNTAAPDNNDTYTIYLPEGRQIPQANVMAWNGTTVSTPATAGIPDVNTKNINNAAAATPGASGGILISGSNSGTTTLGALTVTGATTLTGNVAMAAGLNITQSSANTAALVVTGNGSGNGATFTGGAAVTTTAGGNGISFVGGAASTSSGGTAGVAILATGGAGAASTNGAAGGVKFIGGGTNTVASAAHGFNVTGTSTGDGLSATSGGGATGNGITATAASTNGSGASYVSTGTGSGILTDKLTASGAVAFQSTFAVTTSTSLAAVSATTITASGTTSLAAVTTSGTVTFNAFTVTNVLTVSGATTLTGAVTASNASNNIVGIDVAKISGDATAADNAESFFDGTGYAGTNNVIPTVTAVTNAVATTSNIKKNQALAAFGFLMTDSTTHAPATGKTVTVTRSIDGGAFGAGTLSSVTEVSNGLYAVDFGAGDLNGKVIVLRATATASDDTFERIVTVP